MNPVPAINLAPALQLLALATIIAAVPLALWAWRHRGEGSRSRLLALSALTLFLTADLIVFGSFTRLTDSGLGCPDWPGCYGAASPLGASTHIAAAEQAQPTGAVTQTKAWIEMVHRYLAMTVGALIVVQALLMWRARGTLGRVGVWSIAAVAWVVVQGLFGKYTVTLKLYPAVVTLHLLGGLVLLSLLVAQFESLRGGEPINRQRWVGPVLLLLFMQIALGGWVSTNYAVLACRGFPQCNGQWWPEMDFAQGFALLRELGRDDQNAYLAFPALVAIQMVHRLVACVVTVALAALSLRLWQRGDSSSRRYAATIAAVLLLQWASGLSNVLLDWPLAAALAHSAGAAALVGLLMSLWWRCRGVPDSVHAHPESKLRGRPA